MSDGTEQRKLAAIMFTDMVGYSALSQRDEKLAQALLQEHREILRPIFPRFNGTEIKTIGDGFLIDAALGNKELALQEGRRAMELMPVEKDAINGQRMIAYFALIAAWAGEKDLALEQLKTAVPLPGGSTITSYGVLKLMLFWDPLRGDPRFEKIVESLAPK